MNFAKKIIARNIAKIIGIFLASGILIYLSAKYTIAGIQAGKWTTAYISQMIMMTVGVVLGYTFVKMSDWFERFSDKILNSIEYALKGNSGEKLVKAELEKFLNKNEFKVYSNVKLPYKNFDIDIVVLGQKGITILEIKNWKDSIVFYENEKYFERIKQKSKFVTEITKWYKGDPRKQLNMSIINLRKYLEEMGINTKNIPIQKGIVFPNAVAKWEGKPGIYIISGLQGLKKYFGDNKGKKIPTNEYEILEQIFNKLS